MLLLPTKILLTGISNQSLEKIGVVYLIIQHGQLVDFFDKTYHWL
jgi:hypothetical protein